MSQNDAHPPVYVGRSPTAPLSDRIMALTPVGADGVRRGTFSNLALTSFSNLTVQIIQFFYFILMARLLGPRAFAPAAIVLSVVAFAQIFTDLGIGPALIQRKPLGHEHIVAAFWINMLTGVVLTGGLYFLSYPLAAVFGQPSVRQLMQVASLSFVLTFGVVPLAMLERFLRFERIAVAEISAALFAYGLCAAYSTLHPSSLLIIAPSVLYATTLSVLVWLIAPIRPWARADIRVAAQELRAMISGVTLFNIATFWSRNTDNFLLGRFASALSLGLYSRAFNLVMAPVTQVTTSIGRVLLPTLAGRDQESGRNAFVSTLRLSCTVLFPVAAIATAAAPRIAVGLFGNAWSGMGPILALLAASIPAQVLGGVTGSVYQAKGDTYHLLRRGGLLACASVAAIVVGVPWGAAGVSTALLVRFYVAIPYTMRVPLALVGVTGRELAKLLRPVVIAAVCCALATLLSDHLIAGAQFSSLCLVAIVGLVVYAAVLLLADTHYRRALLARLRHRHRDRS